MSECVRGYVSRCVSVRTWMWTGYLCGHVSVCECGYVSVSVKVCACGFENGCVKGFACGRGCVDVSRVVCAQVYA